MNIARQYLSRSIKSIINATLKPNIFSSQARMSSRSRSEAQHIVWVDLELTGLDIEKDHILEIACLITDSELNIVAMGPNIIIHQPDSILNNMNEWCVNQHGQTGLTDACKKSNTAVSDAENEILKFVKAHVPEKRCPLGGNSVYMDRIFLLKHMPRFNDYLHYRIIDVSSIKELAKRWYPKDFSRIPIKKFEHRCLSDILESIEELKYYKANIFKPLELSHKSLNKSIR